MHTVVLWSPLPCGKTDNGQFGTLPQQHAAGKKRGNYIEAFDCIDGES